METRRRNSSTKPSDDDGAERSRLIPRFEKQKPDYRKPLNSSRNFTRSLTCILVLVGLFVTTTVLVFRTTRTLVDVGDTKVAVECKTVYVPNLTSPVQMYKYSRICYPNDGKQYPLHFFAHGDFGGGPFSVGYHGILHDIASRGFFVAMYLSCEIDWFCDGGNGSFLEILKLMTYFETQAPDQIDFDAGYTVSGHSTGGRVVLFLAALVDHPTTYLADTKYASMITEEQRQSIQKIRAVVGDYPDPIYLSQYNPDVQNFGVDQIPIMIVTGSEDRIQPELSAWKVFETIASPDRVYVNLLGTSHVSPVFQHQEGPYIAHFSKCFLDSSGDGCEAIYGNSSADAIRNAVRIAGIGDRNSGDGRVGFLGCRGGRQDDVPAEYSGYC